ncbi:MAG: type ISP restriction/modification enzyme, partial [Pyrinomonadaceae bacterium]
MGHSLGENKKTAGEAQLHRSAMRQAAEDDDSFAPLDILDYIYAILHSPSYREKYKEFLKIDFPRVPYPRNKNTFWQLVALGGELRQIHLLESPKVNQFITGYPVGGDNVVEKPVFKLLGRNADALVRTEGRFGPNNSTGNQLPELLTKASPEEPAIA